MKNQTSLEQKFLIKKQMELGKKSPCIAKFLGIKVRTVRKYVQLIKKGLAYLHQWDVPKKEHSAVIH